MRANRSWSGHSAEQWHKCNRTERFLVDALLFACEPNQLLLAFGSDGYEQTAPHFQLLNECFRHSERSSGNE